MTQNTVELASLKLRWNILGFHLTHLLFSLPPILPLQASYELHQSNCRQRQSSTAVSTQAGYNRWQVGSCAGACVDRMNGWVVVPKVLHRCRHHFVSRINWQDGAAAHRRTSPPLMLLFLRGGFLWNAVLFAGSKLTKKQRHVGDVEQLRVTSRVMAVYTARDKPSFLGCYCQ